MDHDISLDHCRSSQHSLSKNPNTVTFSIKHTMGSLVQAESKSAAGEQENLGIGSVAPVTLPRNVDPDLALAIAQISPERRVELEKRVKIKLDCFMFPLLLCFYILNYLV